MSKKTNVISLRRSINGPSYEVGRGGRAADLIIPGSHEAYQFYVWLRRSVRSIFPSLFATLVTPKAQELVATPVRHGSKEKAEAFFLHDFTSRFPLAAAAVSALPGRSFLIDGEAIVTNGDGLAVFDLIRRKHHGGASVLIAFDLIELDGKDLRRAPIEHRKRKLAKLVRTPHPGIVLNEHYEGDGEIVFAHACKLGCEGIVSKRLGSKRLGSPYRSGRSAYWVKVKDPKAPAITREAEEDWGR